jgi:hypothetical protein
MCPWRVGALTSMSVSSLLAYEVCAQLASPEDGLVIVLLE